MTAQVFTLTGIVAQQKKEGSRYHEFFRIPTLSAGLYHLLPDAADPQHPHEEDELYHVLRGHASLRVDTEDILVGPGSIVYVPARVPHHFHGITEALEVLVVFGPAESAGC